MLCRVKRCPWFYFLASLYPLLFLWAANVTEIRTDEIVRPILYTIVGSVLLYFLLWFLLRDAAAAAFLGLCLIILFFSYGHVYDLVRHDPHLAVIGRHRFLAPFYGFLALSAAILSFRLRKKISLSPWLTIIVCVLVVVPVMHLGAFYLSSARAQRQITASHGEPLARPVTPKQAFPDIYFIVLDSYARADILQELGFDNSEFLRELQDLGFYVADCSRSNYDHTSYSVLSTLNMEHVYTLKKRYPNFNRRHLVLQSEVRRQLKDMGYKMVAFHSPYTWVDMNDSDFFLTPVLTNPEWQPVSPFEAMYLNTTFVRIYRDFARGRSNSLPEAPPDFPTELTDHVELQQFVLAKLEQLPYLEGPKFVFVHLLTTHLPYVFAPDGSILTDPGFYSGEDLDAINEEYRRQGYLYGIQYTNARLLPILRRILRDSDVPPIILLQGDHSYRGECSDRFAVLSAYYLPQGNDLLYETITPVNIFRIIFSHYFDRPYSLLPDVSYERDFVTVVPETSPACAP